MFNRAIVRTSYGRVAIQAAVFLNGGASVALLAFLGNLAIAHQARGVTGSYTTFKAAFVCFGIGVMLDLALKDCLDWNGALSAGA
jgi:hypothetical protein